MKAVNSNILKTFTVAACPDSLRREINAEAKMLGLKVADFLQYLLDEFREYKNVQARPRATHTEGMPALEMTYSRTSLDPQDMDHAAALVERAQDELPLPHLEDLFLEQGLEYNIILPEADFSSIAQLLTAEQNQD